MERGKDYSDYRQWEFTELIYALQLAKRLLASPDKIREVREYLMKESQKTRGPVIADAILRFSPELAQRLAPGMIKPGKESTNVDAYSLSRKADRKKMLEAFQEMLGEMFPDQPAATTG